MLLNILDLAFSDFDSQKSSEERVAELEKFHKKEMASKDQELNERLQAQEKAFQEKMKAALVSIPKMCRKTFLLSVRWASSLNLTSLHSESPSVLKDINVLQKPKSSETSATRKESSCDYPD